MRRGGPSHANQSIPAVSRNLLWRVVASCGGLLIAQGGKELVEENTGQQQQDQRDADK